jgi:hypothetical protein
MVNEIIWLVVLGSRKDFQKGSSSFQQMLEWRCLLVLQRVLVWRCGYEYESKKTHFTCCAMSNLGDSFKIQSILSCAWKRPMVGGFKHLLYFHILGRIITTAFHFFQRDRYTTNQIWIFKVYHIQVWMLKYLDGLLHSIICSKKTNKHVFIST